jgi:predicted flap endonuclease-1-like 5' DNA nuclease
MFGPEDLTCDTYSKSRIAGVTTAFGLRESAGFMSASPIWVIQQNIKKEQSMRYTIDAIEGIGPSFTKKLAAVGISNTDHLLARCCDRKGRQAVSKESKIAEKKLLAWSNMADLMRISGIGQQFSELLEVAGVDTVKELRKPRSRALARPGTHSPCPGAGCISASAGHRIR